jgi:hypothetical protein
MQIRDNKLYREGYGTFEEYCKEKWDIKRQRAYELISAAEVKENLSEIYDKSEIRESHTKPLKALEPQEQREVYQRTIETAPEGKLLILARE